MANVVKLAKPGGNGNGAGPARAGGDNEVTVTLPLLKGTVGPDVADVRALYKNHGLFTYDPGFMSTQTSSRRPQLRPPH